MSGRIWDWEGDPTATEGWTVVGEDSDGVKLALVEYDSLHGSTSQPLSAGIPGEMLMPREKAEELRARISIMDAAFWPGFRPTLARVQDGAVVETIGGSS